MRTGQDRGVNERRGQTAQSLEQAEREREDKNGTKEREKEGQVRTNEREEI